MSLGAQLDPATYPEPLARLLTAWYRAPDHPCKLRLLRNVEKLLGRRRLIARTTVGFDFSIDQSDLIQRSILYEGIWEPEVTAFFRQTLQPQDVFYDVGGNVGYFSCLALCLGVGRVVAFEPDPLHCAIFNGNVALNPAFVRNRLTIVQEGVAEQPGTLEFHRAGAQNSGMSRFGNFDGVASFDVPVTTLDEVVFHRGLPPPTVLKMDIEGMEWQALQGARRLLRECSPRALLFEADADASLRIADARVSEFFAELGYAIDRLPQKNKIDEKENFVASRPG